LWQVFGTLTSLKALHLYQFDSLQPVTIDEITPLPSTQLEELTVSSENTNRIEIMKRLVPNALDGSLSHLRIGPDFGSLEDDFQAPLSTITHLTLLGTNYSSPIP